MSSRTLRLVAATMTLAVLGGACGGGKQEAAPPPPTETTTAPIPTGPDTVAAKLRSSLDGVLEEHVVLVAASTNASVGGRNDEFGFASGAVDGNSEALTTMIGTIFGSQAGSTFSPLWEKHIQGFFNYAQGQQQALGDLLAFPKAFGALVNSALPDLPADAMADLVKTHVLSVKDVIDAQRAHDQSRAYTNLRTATAQVSTIAEALAAATAAKFPEKVNGNPKSPAATLQSTLNTGLREHVYLLAATTGAALAGRQDEFNGARAALDANSSALAATIASVYGPEAGKAFDPLWRRHIGFFLDYTNALKARDKARQDKAIDDLLAYTATFGAFLHSASPALSADAAGDQIKTHVFTVKDTLDAQGVGNFSAAYSGMRTAAEHMSRIAESLTPVIVKQFPQKF
jgi:hypothetical protein